MRFTSLFLFILMGCTALLAQDPMITGQNQKFLYRDEINGLIMVESLQPGTTLYSLSRKYNVPVELILSINPDLQPTQLPLGYPVNIPVSASAISYEPPAEGENRIWLCYRVQPKETLYRISKTYLEVDPEVIAALNPSAQDGLGIGQVLHIGWLSLSSIPLYPVGAVSDSISLLPTDYISEAKTRGQVIHEQKGLAVWKPGNYTSHYYVLHPTARVGSYMEITNPMLHRTITAKVAGHIPPGLYQSHVGIVVSPSTARALGILDQQFFARWRYVE